MENIKIALLIVLSYIKEAFKWIGRKIKSFFVWVFSKTTIDEKVIEVAEEIADRAKTVKEEMNDVKKAWQNAKLKFYFLQYTTFFCSFFCWFFLRSFFLSWFASTHFFNFFFRFNWFNTPTKTYLTKG